MKENLKLELKPKQNTECESIELEIVNGDNETNSRLDEIDELINDLDSSIDSLTNHSDKLDYSVAIASGIITGIADILFVGQLDIQKGREWSSEKVNEFVIAIAKKFGYNGNDLKGAIKHLENFGAPSDSVYNNFGGALQHHLRDFAHHASPVGLTFSLLTQFTKCAYGTDVTGKFIVVPIENSKFIGKTVYEKAIFGLVYWILHMASDMAGSNGSAGRGTGVPGPILSIVKLLSATPIFNGDEENNVSLIVSKLYNGTLLAERDENGKILKDKDGKPIKYQMDLRGELGVMHQIGKQALPVFINEIFVRGFYFVCRLIDELKKKSSLKEVDWNKTYPINNRTIQRMMTISTAAFWAVDSLDAVVEGAIHSKGSWAEFGRQLLLRVNFVGAGRFTVAIGTDFVMGVRKDKKEKERMLLKAESLYLMDAKLYYGERLMWTAAADAQKSIDTLHEAMNELRAQMTDDMASVKKSMDEIDELDVSKINENNRGLADEILGAL